ncbi:MAG: hypothetical protein ACE37K_20345 [Planctomycetota bacterium]
MRPTLAIVTAAALASCAGPICTVKPSKDAKGVSYALPRTILELVASVTPAEDDGGFDVALSVVPHRVADPRQQFLLQRRDSWFSEDDVDIKVAEEGMLSSIQMTADDKTLEGLGKVLEVGIGIAKLTTGVPVPGGVDSEKVTSANLESWQLPTARQLAENRLDDALRIRLLPAIGTHRRFWALPDSGVIAARFADFPAPGWTLEVELTRSDELQAPPAPSIATAPVAAPSTDAINGVYVRGVQPFVARSRLTWNLPISPDFNLTDVEQALTLKRQAAVERTTDEHETARAKSGVLTARVSKDKEFDTLAAEQAARVHANRAVIQLRQVPAEMTTLGAHLATEMAKLARKRGYATRPAGYAVRGSTAATQQVLVTDYAPISQIPFERATFVKVTENLTFGNGVVTAHDWHRPSSFSAAADFPLKVVERLIALPTELIQLKIYTTAKEKELLDKIEELESSQRALRDARQADEESYYSAVALALDAQRQWLGLTSSATDEQRRTARSAFVQAAITANEAARKIGRNAPFLGISGREL